LCGAALLALFLLSAWEYFWRTRGFTPTLEDSAQLWTEQRLDANRAGKRALALVGSSRFQLGLDPRVLHDALPSYSPFQLAMDGSGPLPALRNLAEDAEFRGSVLVEVLPSSFFPAGSELPTPRQREWFRTTGTRSLVAPLELTLRTALRSRFVFPISSINPQNILRKLSIGDGKLPEPPYWSLRPDRFRPADYSKVDVDPMREHWRRRFAEASPPSPEAMAKLMALLKAWVAAIEGRGGQVVFVRMVASSPVLEVEDQLFPRERYFQALVDAGFHALEFRDIPGVAAVVCPEGSHLDATGAAVFSRRLGEELLRVHLLKPRPEASSPQ
jgi:hypothetical protein